VFILSVYAKVFEIDFDGASEGVAVFTDPDESVGDLFRPRIAHIGELTDILECVGTPWTTEVLDTTDHDTEAVEVLRNFRSVSDILEVRGEETVEELAVFEFGMELGVSLFSSLHNDSLIFLVQIMVTRVDSFA